jgi:hypothetical protein
MTSGVSTYDVHRQGAPEARKPYDFPPCGRTAIRRTKSCPKGQCRPTARPTTDDLLPAALAAAPPEVCALAKRQLHAPAHERVAARRELDDPGVAELWSAPSTRERLRGFLDRLAAR